MGDRNRGAASRDRWVAASWGVPLAALAIGGMLAASALAGVKSYDTKLTMSRAIPLYHGKVKADVAKCVRGRKVVLYEKRPGPDDKVGGDRTGSSGRWKVKVPLSDLEPGDRFRATVRRKLNIVSGDGYECRADRSRTLAFVGD